MQNELDTLRRALDETDDQLTALFLHRLTLVSKVADYKQKSGTPVLDSARESAILTRLCRGLPEEDANAVKTLYHTVFDISKNRQTEYVHHAEQ